MRNAGRVVTRTMLLEHVWGFPFRSADQHRREPYEPAALEAARRVRRRSDRDDPRRRLSDARRMAEPAVAAPPTASPSPMPAAFAAAILLLGVAVYFAADAEFRQQRDQAISTESRRPGRAKPATAWPRWRSEIAEREAANGDRPTSATRCSIAAGRRVAGSLDTPRPALGFSMIDFSDPTRGARSRARAARSISPTAAGWSSRSIRKRSRRSTALS